MLNGLTQAKPGCVVCGAALPHQIALASKTPDPWPCCAQVACKMVLAKRPIMGDVLFKNYLERYARQVRAQAVHNALMQQYSSGKSEENQHAWGLLHASLAQETNPGLIRQVQLPSGPRQLLKLSRLRRKRYRAHLRKKIAMAFSAIESASQAVPATPTAALAPIESRLPGHLCAACGGGCCTLGGDHAYLTVATLQRFIIQHPEMQPEQVVNAYTARLAKYTMHGSCINHTAKGCSLSKEMRSGICNNYCCSELTALEDNLRSPQPVQTILVLRRKQDNWRCADPVLDNPIVALAVLTEIGVDDRSELLAQAG